ncbi:hypothetical protein JMUB6875_30100 [Nocardia sp. JMUB6875]
MPGSRFGASAAAGDALAGVDEGVDDCEAGPDWPPEQPASITAERIRPRRARRAITECTVP